MEKVGSYKDLVVWQKSIDLVVLVYRVTDKYPRDEMYSITSQTRRAAVGIPANIAEGRQRNHNSEFIQFLGIAFGSASELETHLIIAKRLGYLNESDFKKVIDLLDEVNKMLYSLIKKLKSKPE